MEFLVEGKALEILFELYDKGIKLISPEYFVEEFERNIDKLSKQSKLSKEELLTFASILFSEFVEIVPKDRYERFLEEAKKISPDNKDVPYVALALKFKRLEKMLEYGQMTLNLGRNPKSWFGLFILTL